ncbi:Hypp7879 [Branchiostoma lanceolatum]|uniref:Hypp7879 protein n=1 Tax=Branchiostoma lanceolatum TaxID=7740 RepID=A0A8K0EBW0_BRALA|nr:Hypp7879 [Branchiostoma lanceolatum]
MTPHTGITAARTSLNRVGRTLEVPGGSREQGGLGGTLQSGQERAARRVVLQLTTLIIKQHAPARERWGWRPDGDGETARWSSSVSARVSPSVSGVTLGTSPARLHRYAAGVARTVRSSVGTTASGDGGRARRVPPVPPHAELWRSL